LRCVGRTLPRLSSSYTSTRSASNVPSEDPAKKARSILDSLPGNSILSKTAILSSGAGLSIFAISNELYVFNDESIVAIAGFSVLWGLFKYGAPVYNEWARATQDKISGILNASREDHRTAVKSRIENVKQLGGVIDVTKQLFEVSKV
jgi:F-type H+-transporting ATPase subunit b